jgi:predicted DNA-binding transcriptional regulator AlpA
MTMLSENLLDVKAAAELMGLAKHTLYNWRYLGKGPEPIMIGAALRYDPATIREWIITENKRAAGRAARRRVPRK